jgi:hypothetical protein
MKTFYLTFNAVPTADNPESSEVQSGLVHFWVLEHSPDGAARRSNHFLRHYRWQARDLVHPPTEVTEGLYSRDIIARHNFQLAQKYGIAVAFTHLQETAPT